MKRVALAGLVLLLAVHPADARRRGGPPLHVRLVAYIGETVEGTRPQFEWPVMYKGKRFELHVLELKVLSGRATPLDIDAAVAPYAVKFMLAGERTALQRFTNAPPRQQVLLIGYIRLDPAARYLMLDTVDVAYLATPTPGS